METHHTQATTLMAAIVLGAVLMVIALAHFFWPSQIAEFNGNRPSLRINPTTAPGVRALGVVPLLMGLLAVLA